MHSYNSRSVSDDKPYLKTGQLVTLGVSTVPVIVVYGIAYYAMFDNMVRYSDVNLFLFILLPEVYLIGYTLFFVLKNHKSE